MLKFEQQVINDLSDVINYDNSDYILHLFSKFQVKSGKDLDLWSKICSCMDWLNVSITGLQEYPKFSDEDKDKASLEFAHYIMTIDMLTEAIKKLWLTFELAGIKKYPLKDNRSIFNGRPFGKDLTDDKYFKHVRAFWGLHSVNGDLMEVSINGQNMKEIRFFSSWTTKEDDNLADRENLKWSEFKIGDLFEIYSYKKKFDANKVKFLDNGHPYVVRTALNNGVKGYLLEDEMYLNDGNTISFGQDIATMFYQKQPYFTGDKIKIMKSKFEGFNKFNALFFISAMSKSFSSFSWGSSSFSINIIKSQKISLPVNQNGIPDFNIMNNLVKGLHKIIIKDVVGYTDTKIETISNNEM